VTPGGGNRCNACPANGVCRVTDFPNFESDYRKSSRFGSGFGHCKRRAGTAAVAPSTASRTCPYVACRADQ
jgi:hypothetical protein